ncbi:MAG: hypothetical protein HQ574_04105 [Chloroflexi bacterium]|nr:hypothetical protein [Chloroflexota bacterium]
MRNLIVTFILIVVLISSCISSPEIPPTSTPKPTGTMFPHGTLKACIYFGGELVNMGYLRFFNENGIISYLSWVDLDDGCKDVILTPGYYSISPLFFQGPCADVDGGCMADSRFEIDIADGEVIEKDFEVFMSK